MKINFSDLQNSKLFRAAQVGVILPEASVRYYSHGWQSWSLAAWTDISTPL